MIPNNRFLACPSSWPQRERWTSDNRNGAVTSHPCPVEISSRYGIHPTRLLQLVPSTIVAMAHCSPKEIAQVQRSLRTTIQDVVRSVRVLEQHHCHGCASCRQSQKDIGLETVWLRHHYERWRQESVISVLSATPWPIPNSKRSKMKWGCIEVASTWLSIISRRPA